MSGPNAANNVSANRDIANEFISALRDSPYFVEPQNPGGFNTDPNGTFTFGVTVKLKRPLKF